MAERPAALNGIAMPATLGPDLALGGVGVRELATRAGRTPFFAYDTAAIRARAAALSKHLPTGLDMHYAVKANPLPALLALVEPLVSGFDVASAGEMQAALAVARDPARVAFAGPGKGDDEIAAAVAAGVVLEAESVNELARIARIARAAGARAGVALRLNPGIEVRGAGMRMDAATQFGIEAGEARAWLAAGIDPALDYQGLHCFFGSQILDVAALLGAFRHVADLVSGIAALAPTAPRYLNLGGGFGIPYFRGETALDLEAVGKGLQPTIESLARRWPGTRLGLELGRYLVGEAGVYVTRVLDRKVSGGRSYLVTDGGLHHVLAASGNFGQRIRRNYPVAIATRMDAPCDTRLTIVGRNCTPIDILADGVDLPDAGIGDLVAIFQTGAYGLSASPVGFLSHAAPAEILV